ncbi:MAG: hypothetical protein L6R41_007346 [Letrouitia leprolyta]|nr:MAG: hypothetical protein L6R41_007346 [Letrouitia leprolyta]
MENLPVNLISLTIFQVLLFALKASASPSLSPRGSANATLTKESDGTEVWCQPARWYDIIWFIFTNFILHALSVRSLPGERSFTSTVFKFCCFLVPYTGVRRGLCLILRASNFTSNDLQSAARANALCMVIRSPEWRPKDGQIVEGCTIEKHVESKGKKGCASKKKWLRWLWPMQWPTSANKHARRSFADTSSLDREDTSDALALQSLESSEVTLMISDLYQPPVPHKRIDKLTRVLIESYRFRSQRPTTNMVDLANVKIHGICQLAPGYALSYVPEDMKIYSRVKHRRSLSVSRLLGMDHTPDITLASTHDVPRILFSLLQTVSGGYALFKARGSQIEHYGFAAFGLTVVPYMMVSIVNLIGSLLTSEYEAIYMVHSPVMDEMLSRGGLCDGIVGTTERPVHQAYVFIDGEEETVPHGSKIQFSCQGADMQCEELTKKESKTTARVSAENHIVPPKEVWLFESWIHRRRKAKAKSRREPTTYHLLQQQHSKSADFHPELARLWTIPRICGELDRGGYQQAQNHERPLVHLPNLWFISHHGIGGGNTRNDGIRYLQGTFMTTLTPLVSVEV